MPSWLRALWRLLGLLAHLLHGLWQVTWLFPRLPESERQARVQAWSLALLRRCGIRLQVRGQPVVQGPALLVANHISWVDIPLLHAARYCRFISKADVQDWPIVGTLATAGGTLYIQRESRRDALRMVASMQTALEQGQVLAVFPEGTTGDGRQLLPFHANLLQAAVVADAPVQPVGLRFQDAAGAISLAPTYVGDETLIGSVWRTLCAQGLTAVVCFGEAERAEGRQRRELSEDLRQRVDALRRID